jgi:mannose-1-phosphate guanylyltransferase
MIEETVERILPLIPYPKVYTIANSLQTRTVRRLLPKIPQENLLVEPKGKNTAPSLILATAWIYLKNPKAVVAVLPSDHLIIEKRIFLKKLKAAAAAAHSEESLITFGIPPVFPSTGFGYIHYSRERSVKISGERFYHVKEFEEKPSYERAKTFIFAGKYFWNSGMFFWRAEVFARCLEKFAPDFYFFWLRMLKALRAGSKSQIASIFDDIPPLSIDYALMEKAKGVLVCKGNFGWSDVGAWSSLLDIWRKDDLGNASNGLSIVLDSYDSLCFNPGKLTALIGVKDLIVINTNDALLVCRKDQDQRVREILDLLSKKGKSEFF